MVQFKLVKVVIFLLTFVFGSSNLKCAIPDGCQVEKIYEGGKQWKYFSIFCDINNNQFEFKFNDDPNGTFKNCDAYFENRAIFSSMIILRWPLSNELAILEPQFNLTNLNRYFHLFLNAGTLKLIDAKGFDVNIIDKYFFDYETNIQTVHLINCRLDFYHNKRKFQSCQEFIQSNVSRIQSIFQILNTSASEMILKKVKIENSEYKQIICPLFFINISINLLELVYLENTFYKNSILTFLNDTNNRELNSFIKELSLRNMQKINLDLNLLHPKVFKNLSKITIGFGSLNLIDGEIFKHLECLLSIEIYPIILRKINHKQGIKWIRQINYGMSVNLSNLTENDKSMDIILMGTLNSGKTFYPMSRIFPDEDFCIYVEFPFNQLVLVYQYFDEYMFLINLDSKAFYSCTFLWLAQYYERYYEYFQKKYAQEFYIQFYMAPITKVLNLTVFKTRSICNFEERIRLCNKSNYRINDIWDQSDFLILNKKLEIAYKVLLYPTAFIGLFTNIIVVVVILKKDNNDLFKGIKQYSYLYLNSICCIIISLIEILSWMTECFYPFEMFCPEIRKLVAIQFFKIIFKECLVTVLRFMCSFTYVAFALNRISLIGKDHGKLVTFFSELGVHKYIVISLFISISLSWIKGFKYEINYFYSYLNYPISNEIYIFETYGNGFYNKIFTNFFSAFNLISDLINYLLFVAICVVIDICMVVQLRRTLEDRMKKSESMNQKQKEAKKAENEEAINKAIRMVVLNSFIGICFKAPIVIIPLLNVIATFYSKENYNQYINPKIFEFYSFLVDSGYYFLIQDIFYIFYTLSFSIQMFVYNQFDKKFRMGYERLKEELFAYIKNRFKSNSTSKN